MSNPRSQVSGSSYSPTSLISEGPDIKKWFSSYTYDSPVLDTNEDFCFSVRVDEEEKGLYVEDSEIEKEGKFGDLRKNNWSVIHKSIEEARKPEFSSFSDVEVPANPDSLSLPSEPPDIKNWFSSYVYNSPDFDSSDFGVSLSRGYDFGNKKENDKESEDCLKDSPVKDEILGCTKTSTRPCGVENNKNHSTPQKDCTEKSNLFPENSLCPEITSYRRTYRAEQNISKTILDKPVVRPRIKAEDILPIVQESSVDHLRSPAKAPYSSRGFTETREEKKKEELTAASNDSCWISLNRKPSKDQYRRSIIKMREEHKASSKTNKENFAVKSVCSSDAKKYGMSRREILKETTNFDVSPVPEAAGKWRCPQRNKPDTGPPLKQLRLERWVRRI